MQPRGERLRRAIQWISERRQGDGRPPRKLLDEAGLRFDLTPAECEFLGDFYRKSGDGQDAGGSGGPRHEGDAMAEVVVRKDLDVPVERVWETLRAFGDLAKWADGIEACSVEGEGVGAVRTLTVRGGISLRERLESFSDAERRYSYSIPGETVFPFSNYLSTVQVEDLGGERTRVDWRGSFEPKGDAAAGQNLVRGIYEGALASLAKRLGAKLTPAG